jgi:hypothetical protein
MYLESHQVLRLGRGFVMEDNAMEETVLPRGLHQYLEEHLVAAWAFFIVVFVALFAALQVLKSLF